MCKMTPVGKVKLLSEVLPELGVDVRVAAGAAPPELEDDTSLGIESGAELELELVFLSSISGSRIVSPGSRPLVSG